MLYLLFTCIFYHKTPRKSNQQTVQYAQRKTACIKYRQPNRKRITSQNARKRTKRKNKSKIKITPHIEAYRESIFFSKWCIFVHVDETRPQLQQSAPLQAIRGRTPNGQRAQRPEGPAAETRQRSQAQGLPGINTNHARNRRKGDATRGIV